MKSDYSNHNLRGRDFSNRDLTGYIFRGADLRETNFTNSIIKAADFSSSDCEKAKFCNVTAGLPFPLAIRLISILFLAVCVVLLILGYLGQRIGDGIGYSFIKFMADQQDRDELIASIWSISICILLFIIFTYNIKHGLERAFRITVGFGILVVGLAFIRIFILSLVRLSVGYGIPAISGYAVRFLAKTATASVAGLGISFTAVCIAILIIVSKSVTKTERKAVVLVSFLLCLTFLSVTVVIYLSRSGAFSSLTFMLVTLFGVFLGGYVSDQASSNYFKYNIINDIALSLSSIGSTNFQEANLKYADFTSAYLRDVDFRNSELSGVCWLGTRFLIHSRIDGSLLYLKDLEKRLSIIKLLTTGLGAYGNFEGLKLQGINLQGANLKYASFKRADISNANLRDAELSEVSLVQTRLDGVDFTGANLTGACIERWGATPRTKIDQVKCNYIYMKESIEGSREPERIPHRGSFEKDGFREFATSLIGTLDLFHKDDFDSRAVAISFKQLADQYPQEIFKIVALEKTENGQITVKVKTKYAENNEIYKGAYYLQYENILPSLPSRPDQLPLSFLDLDKTVDDLRWGEVSHSPESEERIQFLNLTISNSEVYYRSKKEILMEGDTYNVSGQAGAVGKYARSEQNQFYQSGQSQTLAEAASEIQKLLKQLERNNPMATEAEKIAHVSDETSAGFKRRVISALQSGSEAAIEEFLDNPYVNVGKAVVKGWIKSE